MSEWKKTGSSSGGGYKPLTEREGQSKVVEREETTRERAARQRRERQEELRYSASNEERWARNRKRVLEERGELGKRDTSHINLFLKAKKTEVPKFDLDETLANPELDALKPTNIDPASMLVDDIEELAKEGKEFVNNPTLAGATSMAVIAIPGKFADGVLKGRAGKQLRLRELADDPKLGKADRGWLRQEINAINNGNRKNIRNPPGKDLAHERGREAAKGYSYKHSNLQERKLHRLQHKYDNFGRSNKERPIK